MEELIAEAERLGIKNASLYMLLPPERREEALKADIEKVRKAYEQS